jgi:integrase
MLCRKGIPIQTAAELLGHEDINDTAKYYVNILPEQKQEAVESLLGFMGP